jgi:hypothetical protein
MRRIGIAAAIAAIASLGVSRAAVAAPLQEIDSSLGPVVTDGARYAMWSSSDGHDYIWDTIRNLRLEPQRPGGCRQPREVVLGAGRLLWNCLEDRWTPHGWPGTIWVVNIASRKAKRVPGVGLVGWNSEGGPPRFARMGRYWLSGWEYVHRGAKPFFYQWRTGILGGQQVERPDLVADLDRHGDEPFVRLCRSIRRRPDPAYALSDESWPERFLPMEYEKPFAVSQKGTPGSLVVQSCHSRRRKLLDRDAPFESAQFRSGFVTWPRLSGAAVAYVPRSRREFTWTVSGPLTGFEVRHTANRIFVSQRYGERWFIRSAPFHPR